MCEKCQALNSLFSNVHSGLSHQLPTPSTEADETERCVKLYMSFFSTTVPPSACHPKTTPAGVPLCPTDQEMEFGHGVSRGARW